MTTKNKFITTALLTTTTLTSIAALNKYLKMTATSKNILTSSDKSTSNFYHWRLGDIYYTKSGSGRPLLLIHDLNSASSGFQWKQLIPTLSKRYTVYTIDLLGCGRSEKPYLTYTNYLYVQMISDFIKSEIGHRTDVIANGNSGNFIVMACSHTPELFNRIIWVNPDSVSSYNRLPGKYTKFYKNFLDMPIIGTLLYHITTSKHSLIDTFKKEYFSNSNSVKESYIDAYYEAAHLGTSPKSICASVQCKYTNCNITNALKKIDNSIYLIGGEDLYKKKEILNEYISYNPAIEYTLIPHTKFLPHMERPVEFLTAVYTYLS